MSWNKLTTDDIKKILSQDELERLKDISVDPGIQNVVQDAIDLVADMFRGAFKAKGYPIDTREHYIPSSYALPVLQYARYVAWSRFPNSPDIALDEVRKEEVKRLVELLKNPYIGAEKPEWEHSSENPDNLESGKSKNSLGTIVIPPYLRFDETLYCWSAISAI